MPAGNHDHGLVAGWIDGRLLTEPSGLPRARAAHRAARRRPARRAPRRAAPRRRGVEFAYPGVWLRDDVFAIHGHYSDLHTHRARRSSGSPPGAMARWVGRAARATAPRPTTTRRRSRRCTRGCTRSRSAPTHARRQRRARRVGARLGRAGRPRAAGGGRCARPLLARRLRAPRSRRSTRSASGRSSADLSGAGAAARQPARHRARCCAGSACDAPHVLCGHSHRSGPVAGRRPRRVDDRAPAARIVNTGSWVYQPHFLSDAPERARPTGRGPRSLDRGRAARRGCVRLLGDRGHEELATPGVKHVAWHVDARADRERRARPPCGAGARPAGSSRGSVDRDRAAVDGHLAGALAAPPTRRPPRTGRCRRRAGPRSAPGSSAPGASSGRTRRAAARARRRAAPGSRARSPRRRPRRSAARTARRRVSHR